MNDCTLLSLLLIFLVASRELPAQGISQMQTDSAIIVLLGTGMPRPNPGASGPTTAVVLGKRTFLIDAGPGVMRQLSAAKLPIDGVTALFLTHLHTDHTLGYPDLIFTSWVMGRKTAIPVYGPRGLQRMTDHLIAAWAEDIEIRTSGLEREAENGWAVTAHEIEEGVIYDSGGVRVTAIPVQHGNWKRAYAFRFDIPGRSIVISGDTRPCETLAESSRGVDVLVHEVYSASHLKPEKRPGGDDWIQYMHEFHTSDVELGAFAARCNPKLLILTHLIRMGATDEELLEGIRAGGFNGRVVVGADLDRY